MEAIRCLLVDDERLARQLLRSLLAPYPAFAIVGEAADIGQAAAAVRRHRPELLFLDIQMPEGDGFQLLRDLLPDPPAVVFITAYDRHAVRAFTVNALDYLLKPIEPERLEAALQRVQRRLRRPGAGALPCGEVLPLRPEDRLLIQAGQSGFFVRVNDILVVTADGNYTRVKTADGQQTVVRQTLANWLARLPASTFLQVDRASIVNLCRLAKTALSYHCARVQFDVPGVELELGRHGASRLKQALRALAGALPQ